MASIFVGYRQGLQWLRDWVPQIMCHMRWNKFSACVLCSSRWTRQLWRTKQHVQCAPVQKPQQERELRKNPCLEGTHRYLLGIQSLLIIGGSPPSKMQFDVMLLSALHIRGRCLEHLPKGCSGSSPRTVLSWAGNFHQHSPAAQPRPLTARGAQGPDSSLAIRQPAPGDLLHAGSCSLCLSH